MATMRLASCLKIIADATKNEIFYAVHYPIGNFGVEITSFYPLIVTPLLPEEVRKDYEADFSNAIEEGVKALETLKSELCKSGAPDLAKVIKSLGELAKHDSILAEKRERVLRARPPLVPMALETQAFP